MPVKSTETERKRSEIGERIRSGRLAAGLTQAQLAAALSVTKNAVTNWESGSARPDLSLIAPLCRLLGISADALLGCRAAAVQLSRKERDHLALYRRLNVYDKSRCDALMQSIVRGYDQACLEEHRDDYLRLPQYELYFAAGSGHPLDAGTEESFAYLPREGAAGRADSCTATTPPLPFARPTNWAASSASATCWAPWTSGQRPPNTRPRCWTTSCPPAPVPACTAFDQRRKP